MSVWLTIPSARPPEEAEKCLKLWRERGYKIALWVDSVKDGDAKQNLSQIDYYSAAGYPGYAKAVNTLVRDTIEEHGANADSAAEWFVIGGDDTEPDPNKSAEEIARECREEFHSRGCIGHEGCRYPQTFGVMQPTGDRWGADEYWAKQKYPDAPAYIDRICGSAWYGREYCLRMYGGRGPLWHEYFHMFVDEEAQEVAKKMGVLWQRRDLTQMHNHWGRNQGNVSSGEPVAPDHLKKAVSPQHWEQAGKLFRERKAAGFPGHEPL